MILKEEKRNLFEVDDKYYLAHCISSDCAIGAGIAVEFQKKFKLRNKLLQHYTGHPTCIQIGRIFNLITKEKYWHKPTKDSLKESVTMMKELAINEEVMFIAMPKIGCGLDRLQWGEVREMLKEVFDDTDIEILVCHL
ncbi:MAG: hypothetical protein A2Y34_04005 [Spirochaetes bacterium GWC1_27_15]|nr:MAG: hypothetical protein A2Y34_04005 [Spirochaetes bacterium GWC1_27_15]